MRNGILLLVLMKYRWFGIQWEVVWCLEGNIVEVGGRGMMEEVDMVCIVGFGLRQIVRWG